MLAPSSAGSLPLHRPDPLSKEARLATEAQMSRGASTRSRAARRAAAVPVMLFLLTTLMLWLVRTTWHHAADRSSHRHHAATATAAARTTGASEHLACFARGSAAADALKVVPGAVMTPDAVCVAPSPPASVVGSLSMGMPRPGAATATAPSPPAVPRDPAPFPDDPEDDDAHHAQAPPSSLRFWLNVLGTGLLVLVGGTYAGLTIGIMSQDPTQLHIQLHSADPTQRKYAAAILPIRKQGHWLLSTLLLGNVIVNESLPILMHAFVGTGLAAIVISTGLVVLFGEVIPNAICARYGLAIGANLVWFVRCSMWCMAPVAWPVAKCLDYFLGEEEGTVYERGELKTLVHLQEGEDRPGGLLHDEVLILSAILDLKEKPVSAVATPLDSVFAVSLDQTIDAEFVSHILARGHSRIPVYDATPDHLVRVLLAKRLIGVDYTSSNLKVRDLPTRPLPLVRGDANLYDMLNYFQEGRSHMVAVAKMPPRTPTSEDGIEPVMATTSPGAIEVPLPPASTGAKHAGGDHRTDRPAILGIITLEDVIEEMIGEEIVDETDEYIDIITKRPVMRGNSHGPITSAHAGDDDGGDAVMVTVIKDGAPLASPNQSKTLTLDPEEGICPADPEADCHTCGVFESVLPAHSAVAHAPASSTAAPTTPSSATKPAPASGPAAASASKVKGGARNKVATGAVSTPGAGAGAGTGPSTPYTAMPCAHCGHVTVRPEINMEAAATMPWMPIHPGTPVTPSTPTAAGGARTMRGMGSGMHVPLMAARGLMRAGSHPAGLTSPAHGATAVAGGPSTTSRPSLVHAATGMLVAPRHRGNEAAAPTGGASHREEDETGAADADAHETDSLLPR